MADFEKAFKITLGYEGGYSNHKKDKGGETYKGIARNFWPDWAGWRLIDKIKERMPPCHWTANFNGSIQLQEQVKSFYRYHFWDALKCGQMPQEIANELFDTSVNMGTGYGTKCLQRALNKLNRNQKDYPDINVDGGIGNQTLDALEAYLLTKRYSSRNSEMLNYWLLKWMNFYQLKRYDDISNKDFEQEIFVPGWTNRV